MLSLPENYWVYNMKFLHFQRGNFPKNASFSCYGNLVSCSQLFPLGKGLVNWSTVSIALVQRTTENPVVDKWC